MTRGLLAFDRILNALSFCLLMVVVVSLVRHSSSAVSQPSNNDPKPGTPIGMNTDWSHSGHTLILVLASNCPFCENNAAFHSLLAHHANPHLHVMAVFKKSVDDVASGKLYLTRHNIDIDDIRSAPLGELAARGTPTIILVDQSGHVVRSWVGALDSAGQQDVIDAVDSKVPLLRRLSQSVRQFVP